MNPKGMRSSKLALTVLLTTALMLASGGTAIAGPFDPAYRGEDNSVHALFDWATFGAPWILSEFNTGDSTYALDRRPQQGPRPAATSISRSPTSSTRSR